MEPTGSIGILFQEILQMRYTLLALFAVVAAAALGCGGAAYDGPARIPVSGTVNFEGQPLTEGMIFFVPDGHEGRQSSAPIGNGKFTIVEDAGPNEGKYKVRIIAAEPGASAEPDTESEPGEGDEEGEEVVEEDVGKASQMLPPKYNDQTELTADIKAEMAPLKFDLTK